jgi:hypothetical protein
VRYINFDPILTINGGSSTFEFAAFTSASVPQRILTGQVDGIGRADTALCARNTSRAETYRGGAVRATDHVQAAQSLIDWIPEWGDLRRKFSKRIAKVRENDGAISPVSTALPVV